MICIILYLPEEVYKKYKKLKKMLYNNYNIKEEQILDFLILNILINKKHFNRFMKSKHEIKNKKKYEIEFCNLKDETLNEIFKIKKKYDKTLEEIINEIIVYSSNNIKEIITSNDY